MGSLLKNLAACLLSSCLLLPIVCAFTSVHRSHHLYELEGQILAAAKPKFDRIGNRFRLSSFQEFLRVTRLDRSMNSESQISTLPPVIQYRLHNRFLRKWPYWRRRLARFAHPRIQKFLQQYQRFSSKYEHIDLIPRLSNSHSAYSFIQLELYYGRKADLSPVDSGTTGSSFHLSTCELLEIAVSCLHLQCDDCAIPFFVVAPLWVERAIRHLRLLYPYWSDNERLDRVIHFCRRTGPPLKRSTHQRLISVANDLRFRLGVYQDFVSLVVRADPRIQSCRLQEKMEFPLFCFYFEGMLGPYAPFKYELRHRFVAVIHDFLPPSLASNIIKAAAPTIHVSKVAKGEGSASRLTVRLSESGDLEDALPLRRWLDKRFQVATLFNTDVQPRGTSSSSEIPTVTNYGIGGFYDAHFDFFQNRSGLELPPSPSGDRIATVMVYLSGDLYGGHTAFNEIDVSIKPVIGDALFWFNLDPFTHKPLNDSLHTACPVIHGNKWIVTKWIREYNNFGILMPKRSSFTNRHRCYSVQ